MELKPYLRFWWRTSLVFTPLVVLVLYASDVELKYSLLALIGVPVLGLLLVLPFILMFSRTDRSLWSPEEEIKRKIRFEQKMRELHEAEYGPEDAEDDDDEWEYVYDDEPEEDDAEVQRGRHR